ncbi:N-acetylneuraminate synthase family protein [Xanthocytophaga agilis]|uniref:N-acetylneuraminate synthase family protein n=1 Tax=Xanthocytophaga agilis TaxID=3048010 RepID=A0AAE3R2J5_9BACT|nr:N-acetylneuraminate synthase family protein [Xanthocytophaga agilis]MDJ1502574.1 N-acetylneuraminate synthase family protein [Xanthocytophaga agilis]
MNPLFNDLFIFEMANNHQGDVNHGLAIIREMGKIKRKYNINAAVKFQYRQLDTFIHPDYRNNTEAKHISRFLSTELSLDDYYTMVKATREEGLVTICTPFDEESVDIILKHGIEIIKVASASADDWPLLQKIAKAGKPIIASTGGLLMPQIDNLVSFLRHRTVDFAVLHCVGIYPSPDNVLHLNFLEKIIRRYPDVTIGYSGHEAPDNTDVAKIAIAKGAKILERHVGLPTDTIKLNNYSMNPEQVDQWIAATLQAKIICGNNEKSVTQAEIDSLLSLKRGVFAKRALKSGQEITADDVFFAMPCQPGQLTSGEFGRYRAKWKASKDYKLNEGVFETNPPDLYTQIRGIIHQAKGLFTEAGVVLGDNYEVELSHHYGLENFATTGCLIVNIINREYCKKLIVVLPGQSHPSHKHKKKEETFQLLYGDLKAQLEDRQYILKPGDQLLVERETWHSFSSEKGAIFEEISTTHFRNDSFYEDESIAALDPMQRKTVLEEF